jgi:hypothetical protein
MIFDYLQWNHNTSLLVVEVMNMRIVYSIAEGQIRDIQKTKPVKWEVALNKGE